MSPHTLISAFTGLIFLGINCSVCLGAKDSQLLPVLADLQENIEPEEDNKQNPQLMKVIEQYESRMSDGKSNERMRLEAAEGTMKNLPEEDGSETGEEQYLAKRLAKIQRSFGDFFKSRPGFRNWGGKRSKSGYGDKKTSFSRWGGKRSKFNNWGGKRSETEKPAGGDKYMFEKRDPEYSVPYEQGGHDEEDIFKRNGFKTWAGKRVSDLGYDRSLARHFLFVPWAGKMYLKQEELLQGLESNVRDTLSSLRKDEHTGENYSFRDSFEGGTGPGKMRFHLNEESR